MRNMLSTVACTALASAAVVAMTSTASAVPIEVVYSGTVSSTSFTGSDFGAAGVGDALSLTISFDTDDQVLTGGSVSAQYLDYSYEFDINGTINSGTTDRAFRFASDADAQLGDFYELETTVFDIIDAGGGYFFGTASAVAEGTTLNPFGLVTANIEDVAGTYNASVFDTTTFTVEAFTGNFDFEQLSVEIDTVTVTVIPAPGAAAAFSLAGVALIRRRR